MNKDTDFPDFCASQESRKKEVLFHGLRISPGIAFGIVQKHEYIDSFRLMSETLHKISAEDVNEEIALFDSAVKKTSEQISDLIQNHEKNGADQKLMRIWKSHLLMVEDHSIRQMVVEKISNEFLSAGEAFHLAVFKYIEILNRSEYTRERSADLKDTASHLLQNLSGLKNKSFKKICDRVIIVAKNILPTDMLEMKNQNVCGLCLEDGSRTGHVAILARSFNIPTIMGIHRLFDNVQGGEQLILDGYDGIAILNPVKETLDFYRKKIDEEMLLFREIQSENSLDAQTTDGFRIKLMANVEGCTNSDDLIKYGADGIGLFRTEYMFLKSNSIPDEETQFQTFKQQLLQMQGKPLVIRTQDIGGDKYLSSISGNTDTADANPFLGFRAIRLMHQYPAILENQMKAVLRAGCFGEIKILFPMVCCEEEIDYLLNTLEHCKKELDQRNLQYDKNIQVGIMIEIPSAAICSARFAQKVDFFSIGTNDLIQYTLAVDRTNKKIASLYNPANPAVLSLIAQTVWNAQKAKIPVCVCGEMAADPMFTPFFIGLGVDELSMSSISIAAIKKVIRKLSRNQIKEFVHGAIDPEKNQKTFAEYLDMLKNTVPEIAQDLSAY